VEVPGGDRPAIIVDSRSVTEFEATLQEWPANGTPGVKARSWRELDLKAKREGHFTVYTLDPLDGRSAQLLTATAKFQGGNELTYYWRLQRAR
jgi:hypothetical protein